MARSRKHIALLLAVTLAVSTVGLPVVVYYCTMQGTMQTTNNCCACPSQQNDAHARVMTRSCLEQTTVGTPIAITSTVSKSALTHVVLSVVAFIPSNSLITSPSSGAAGAFVARDASPPPLLRTSVLRI